MNLESNCPLWKCKPYSVLNRRALPTTERGLGTRRNYLWILPKCLKLCFSSSESYPSLLTHCLIPTNTIFRALPMSPEFRLGQSFLVPWLSSHASSCSWHPFFKDQPSCHLWYEDPTTHTGGMGAPQPQVPATHRVSILVQALLRSVIICWTI